MAVPYGKVVRKTWRRQTFRKLPDELKILLLYIWTGPQAAGSPAYHYVSLPTVADDLGWDREQVLRGMKRLIKADWFEYDFEAKVIFLPKQFEYDPPSNPNVVKGQIAKALDEPKSLLFNKYIEAIKPFAEAYSITLPKPFRNPFETPSKPLRTPDPLPEPEPDPEPEKKECLFFQEIIEHLNQITGKNYAWDSKKGSKNREFIQARWSDGYREQDFYHVHTVKAQEWLGTKMEKYLRPQTLYRPAHFESYLNQRPERPIDKLSDQNRENLLAGMRVLKKHGVEIDGEQRRQIKDDRSTKQTGKVVQQKSG